MERKQKKQYFTIYSLAFALISAVMIGVFASHGRSFIWAKDGAAQHYPALVYIHRFLVALVKNIAHGKFAFPMVDFTIGEGMDIITTLNYYGFGDPLTLLSVFCPQKHLEIMYAILIFLRLYLSGVFFSLFCFGKKHTETTPVLAGALSYVFCGYALYAAVRHPFFINGMMYLPLYLLGIERILQKRKYGLFSIVVTLSLWSNFYFGYMNTVMMAFYVLFYIIPEKQHTWLEKTGELGKMILAYIRGVALSAAIMIPMVMAFLNCSRGGEGGYDGSLLQYPKEFYKAFREAYIVPTTDIGQWTNLSFSIFCLVAVILLFIVRTSSREKKLRNRKLQISYILLTLMMLVPLAGKVMNGFGYVSNRWNYAYAMLNAYILVVMLPDVVDALSKKWARKKIMEIISVMVTVNLMCNVFLTYNNDVTNYLDQFVKAGKINNTETDTSIVAVKGIDKDKEDSFYRVEQPWYIGNQSLLLNYPGHSWYFSVAPSDFFHYYNSFELNSMERTYSLRGLDSRAVLNELTATKYYTTDNKEDGLIPYGYEYVKTVKAANGKESYLYENKNYLPVGYAVSGWMKTSDYNKLTPIQKQEALLQSVILDDSEKSSLFTMPKDSTELSLSSKQEVCRVVNSNGIDWNNNTLQVKQQNATITLAFDGMENCETYLWMNNFQVEKSGSQYQTAAVYSGTTKNSFVLMNPQKSAWYDEPNQTVNLGYSKAKRKQCKIIFPKKGVYSLKDFVVVYEPMDTYQNRVDILQHNTLRNVKKSTNEISGDIRVSATKLLQMSIPYSTGWKAYVDGEETKIYKSNEMYMALQLSPGNHKVVFKYETPYLKAGIAVSAVGLLTLLVPAIYARRRRKVDKSVI